VTIQRNTVIRSGREGTKAGISVKGDSVVRYNTVIRCPNFGIRIKNSNNIVEDNLIAGTRKSPIENSDGNNTIQRNIILTSDNE
jgi:parallel beta-helix repeat protein